MKKNINVMIIISIFLAFTSYFLDWNTIIYILFSMSFLAFSGIKIYYILKTENKKTKNKFFSSINLLLVFLITAALFLIFLKYPITIDLTTNKTYSLTDKTKEVISSINFPIKILVFQTDNTPDLSLGEEGYKIYNHLKNLLAEYKRRNPKIEIEYIDPNEEPMRAKSYNLRNIGDVVIESQKGNRYIEKSSMVKWGFDKDMFGGFRRIIEAYKTEEKITGSLISLIEEGKISIDWIIGDEELSLTSENGASILKEALENNNFEIKEVKSTEKLPDANVYIIAGAKKLIPKELIESMKEKLKEKNKILIVLQDPLIEIEDNGINDIIKDYGLIFRNWIVVDEKNSFRSPINIIPEYVPSKITNILEEKKIPVVMSLASVIEEIEVKDFEKERVLLGSSSAEIVQNIKKVAKTGITKEDRTKKKEIIIAEIAKNKNTNSKVVAITDSEFISNSLINLGANKDFFINLLNYILEKNTPLSIEKPVEKERRMMISEGTKKYYFYFYVILLPLIIAGIGIYAGIKRRKLRTL